ncbi:hypothetical protein RGE_31830 [Rubrivivax gelatinosus IL144]|uniref:Uncharacterized protein n=1 Tax=Rubrivivax gelatinosus (strain NBRC 100245 / IL144) TaxID=983917 RepID=I0HU35_RUBGI|nr:hypothetical protein RGE_31830 [Rubrivivax gelatinosus IL144]
MRWVVGDEFAGIDSRSTTVARLTCKGLRRTNAGHGAAMRGGIQVAQ